MEIKDFWTQRRTVRKYTSQPVDDILLNRLIEDAAHAPTTGNMQLYSVIVTRDDEMKKKLAPAHFNQPVVTQAPVVLTFCADFNRFTKWCEASNADAGYGNFQGFITAMLDVVIFAQQFVTAAEMSGLGCCYLGTTTYNAPQIAELLDLPALVVPVVTVTVGYPDGNFNVSDRMPLDAIIHLEKYDNYSEKQIKEYYAEKESLPEMKSFVAENGKQSLAQVFTDIRYKRSDFEFFSKVYKDFILSQGFEF